MGGLHHLFCDVIGQCPQQRHALRRGEGQIEPMHAALRKAASGLTIGCDPVIKPALCYLRISRTPVGGAPIQPDQLRGAACVADDQPRRRPGITLGVVLPQPAVGAPAIQAGLASLAGGVVVIVDTPPR